MPPLAAVSGGDLPRIQLSGNGVEACVTSRLDVANDRQDVGRKLCRLRPTGYAHALEAPAGSGGNLGGACLSENSNAATFRFDCINNADNFLSDFVSTIIAECYRRSIQRLAWLENSDLALVLENRSGLHARICDFIPFGIPKDWFSDLNSFGPLRPNFVLGNGADNEGNKSVLTVVS